MTKDARGQLDRNKAKLDKKAEAGSISETDRELVFELLDAYDESKITVPKPDGESYRTLQTLAGWATRLSNVAEHVELSEATADDVNRVFQTVFLEEKGLKKVTVRGYQASTKRFYRFHSDLDVDPGDISLVKNDGGGFDPEDMLTRDEVDAVLDTPTHPRDRLIVYLLLYTGQRNTALRTLRIKDIDTKSGTYRLNPEMGGLKRADKNGGRRPLLGATGVVRRWINNNHPTGDPDHYLITSKEGKGEPPTEPVSRELIRRTMNDIKQESGVEKPLHPHMLRHNFVTICKRDYEMDNDVIKYLIGHAPDSKVMETTYAHLSDSDWIEKAEAQFEGREPEVERKAFTPQICDICDTRLPENAKACSNCGAVYTPDSQATQQQIRNDIKQDYRETDPEDDADTQEKIDTLDELLEDPEVKAALLEKLNE